MIGEIYLSSDHLASGSGLYTPVVYTRFHAGRARQCLAPTRSGQTLHVSHRRGDPPGRPRSFMPTRSFTAGTNKSRGNAPPPRSGQNLHVSQRRGDPPGRPRSFMPTRSFIAATIKSRGMASPLRGPAKRSMCPNVGATHRVALGHSCQHARSRPGQTNREAMPRPHGPAKTSMCPNVGATHRVALGHSCQHARSWPRQSNREAEGEAMPRPYAVRPNAPCVPS